METSKPERAPQLADKYVLRMPDGMRDKISALAKANNRSMNAEIVLILQQALESHANETAPSAVAATVSPSGAFMLDVNALAAALTPKLAEEIAARVAARLKDTYV